MATMRLALDPFRLLLISLAGFLNQRQQDVIKYLHEENRVLREQLGGGGQAVAGFQPGCRCFDFPMLKSC
jgi:hypothetical protein